MQSLDIEIGFLKPRYEIAESYNPDEIATTFLRAFNTQIFSVGQVLVFDFHGENLKGTVKGLLKVDLPNGRPALGEQAGILMDKTDVTFIKAADSLIKLRGSSKKCVRQSTSATSMLIPLLIDRGASNAILAPSFKFEDMGIGGLDAEFGAIFRRAFASRVFPPGLVERLGIQHVKGSNCVSKMLFVLV